MVCTFKECTSLKKKRYYDIFFFFFFFKFLVTGGKIKKKILQYIRPIEYSYILHDSKFANATCSITEVCFQSWTHSLIKSSVKCVKALHITGKRTRETQFLEAKVFQYHNTFQLDCYECSKRQMC